MKKLLPAFLIVNLAAFSLSAAAADFTQVINFDAVKPLGDTTVSVPAGFGSTAGVSVSYRTLNTNGTTAFSDVLLDGSGYAFAHQNGLLLEITLTATDPNADVLLRTFDVASVMDNSSATDLRVVDENNIPLVNYAMPMNAAFPASSTPHTFVPFVSANSLSIILGTDWAIGVNNISYSYSVSSVPVPASTWLFGSGLLGLTGLARKRNNT